MQVQNLLDRLKAAAQADGFELEPFGAIGGYLLPALRRKSEKPDAAHLYISAGVHGDEPAGPLAVLEVLRKRRLSPQIEWSIIPVVNPIGLEGRTRENKDLIDLNRDYGPNPVSTEVRNHLKWLGNRQFSAAICLHEDYETDGSYLYELKDNDVSSNAQIILDGMRPWTGIEQRAEIDEMPNVGGLMQPPLDRFTPENTDLPEAIRLTYNHTRWCYTIETPSQKVITDRIGAQVAALDALSRIALEGGFQNR
jgi:hypothetical protein